MQVELHSLHLREGFDAPDWILSEPERHRAAAFRSAEARRLFVAGRFLCRRILGSLLACAPQTLSIAITRSGRPYLSDYPDIDFNISHARDRVVLAICRGGRIGIDIERFDAFSEKEAYEILPMILSEHELDQVRQLDARHRHDAFLACWVQKEAALKCLGQGFLADPQSVTLAPDDTTSSIECQVSGEPIFIRSGQTAGEESGDFQWAIATSRVAAEPQWQHHISGISL
ncbi:MULTISPECIES: 4'-phosphopantetheinyl transferase superfamily protein [unclassified Rhizobium]|uniref:4'-phosphopantetheinyl transferase family protein n=1 Tax=unclassified Rhizobium TaxID=2613769 RepID=UPI001FDF238C|nr:MULTISPECIES: 4'-phosphopantetheinyl transferase superfamily protein [unclassified Rhizobium]